MTAHRFNRKKCTVPYDDKASMLIARRPRNLACRLLRTNFQVRASTTSLLSRNLLPNAPRLLGVRAESGATSLLATSLLPCAPRLLRVRSGSEWEALAGYCRAVRRGPRIYVSGTTATHGTGAVCAGDAASQAVYVLDKILASVVALGGRRERRA